MLRFLSLITLLITSLGAFAQPSNDDCSNAIAVSVGAECVLEPYSTADATTEGTEVAPQPSCGFFQGNDVWFRFTAPLSGRFRIEVDAAGNNATWVLYSGSCGNFTSVLCASDVNNVRRNFNDPSMGGVEYYLRVFRYAGTAAIDFNLCIFETEVPVNDKCADATQLTVTAECEAQTFTTLYATGEGTAVVPNPSCGFYQGNDVWFRFTAPVSGQFRIEMDAPGNNATWVLYSGSCGNFTSVLCAADVNNVRRNFNDPSMGGVEYYLRVFRYAGTAAIDFNLCIFETEVPVNDNCADATQLTVTAECEPQTFTTLYATGEGTAVAPNPSCGFYQGNDVWFRFTAPVSGQFRIEMDAPGNNATWVLYSGSCGNFTSVLCAADVNNVRRNFNDPSMGGVEYYLRVFRFASNTSVDFNLCIFETEAPVNDNCANATSIDLNAVCLGELSTTLHATGEGTAVAPNPSCGFYQGNDVWFMFTVPSSGDFRIDNDSPGNNASWALYTGTCGALTEVTCASNVNQLDQTLSLPQLAGEQVYLRVFRFASNNAIEFTLCIFEVETPVNDNCENAIALTGNAVCTAEPFSSVFSTAQTVDTAPQPSCGFFAGGDVWFTYTVPASGQFTINLTHYSGAFTHYAMYSGTCGAFVELDCTDAGSNSYNNPEWAGQTLYLRFWSLSSSQGGTFAVCIEATEPPINDFCEQAIALPYDGVTCDPVPYSTLFASSSEGEQGIPSCGGYVGGDVWFTLQMPPSGPVQLQLAGLNNDLFRAAVYQGECTALTQVACIGSSGALNIVNSNLADELLHIRVWPFNTTDGEGSFTLCAGPANCLADLNFDGTVNATDLSIFLAEFGCSQNCIADFNGDNTVTSSDLSIFLAAFGALCIN